MLLARCAVWSVTTKNMNQPIVRRQNTGITFQGSAYPLRLSFYTHLQDETLQ